LCFLPFFFFLSCVAFEAGEKLPLGMYGVFEYVCWLIEVAGELLFGEILESPAEEAEVGAVVDGGCHLKAAM
jgi:hypothetical protein